MTSLDTTRHDVHADWLARSPGARALARHGIDWIEEPRVPLVLGWDPRELPPNDHRIAPAIDLYGGAVVRSQDGTRIVQFSEVPPLFADTLTWDQEEYCGWWVIE